VGISFESHQVLAVGTGNIFQFLVDDVEISIGTTVLDGVVSVSEYVQNSKDEVSRYLKTSLRVYYKGYTVAVDGGFVTGSNNRNIPFFNVVLKEHHLNSEELTRDVDNWEIFQVHSVNQLREISDPSFFADFVVAVLFAK
jgi:hypothetical protein